MKKLMMIFAIMLALSNAVWAGDIPCHGKVIFAMADHGGCIDDKGKKQMAFVTSSSSNPWMCALTDLGSSMVLAASLSNKPMQVYISDKNADHSCSSIPNYSKVSYLIIPNT